jgi:uncharacterized protein with ATP-grasp and redox domains
MRWIGDAMQPQLECLTCFCRQALEAVRFATDDTAVHEEVLRGVLRQASEMDFRVTPPEMGRYIHEFIRDLSHNSDPYRRVKKESNRVALDLYSELREKVTQASDPLKAAIRIAIAGNIVDYAATPELDERKIAQTVETAVRTPMMERGLDGFRTDLGRAERILYIGDNAGEIVFDRLLIEQLPVEKVTYVVRAHPIINDATMEDAREVGLTGRVEVIDNGDNTPGTVLERCSDEFRKRFEEADLILAKGQGNYETLSDAPRQVFFLLMAKCPVIARDIGCEIGRPVFLAGGHAGGGAGANNEDNNAGQQHGAGAEAVGRARSLIPD